MLRSPSRFGIAVTSILLYAAALFWPGLHRTLVPHAWDGDGGHHCLEHSAAAEQGAEAQEQGQEREEGPGLSSTGNPAGHTAPCPYDGPQRPEQRVPTRFVEGSSRLLQEARSTDPSPVPRCERIERFRLAPKGSPPRSV